jgi:hypothetical protein
MNPCRKFLLACAAGLSVALLLYFTLIYWQLGAATSSSYWCYEMNRRKLASAAAVHQPKLLLVGGSGTLFSLKARRIQEALGVPTVNLGTHAALGIDYVLDWARQAMAPGDTVLLCLEYELYEWGEANRLQWAGDIFTDYTMARDPDRFRALPWRDQVELALSVPLQRLKRGVLARIAGPPRVRPSRKSTFYDPDLIDAYGDLSYPPQTRTNVAPQPAFAPAVLARGLSPRPSGIPAVQRFCRWARSHNVRVLATYPSLAYQREYDSSQARAALGSVENFYRAEGVPVIGSAGDSMLPRDQFLDTCYHLNQDAAVERTARLVPELARLVHPLRGH